MMELWHFAFSNVNIKAIDFPSSLEEICDRTFHKNENLESKLFPSDSKLKNIGMNAFGDCYIKSIDFTSSLETIEKEVL